MDALMQSVDNMIQLLTNKNEESSLELEDFGLPVDTQDALTALEDQLRDKLKRAKLV
jgi:hypothetical protein